jgi:hypothetical protein
MHPRMSVGIRIFRQLQGFRANDRGWEFMIMVMVVMGM